MGKYEGAVLLVYCINSSKYYVIKFVKGFDIYGDSDTSTLMLIPRIR